MLPQSRARLPCIDEDSSCLADVLQYAHMGNMQRDLAAMIGKRRTALGCGAVRNLGWKSAVASCEPGFEAVAMGLVIAPEPPTIQALKPQSPEAWNGKGKATLG
jgi:hypothetical protein